MKSFIGLHKEVDEFFLIDFLFATITHSLVNLLKFTCSQRPFQIGHDLSELTFRYSSIPVSIEYFEYLPKFSGCICFLHYSELNILPTYASDVKIINSRLCHLHLFRRLARLFWPHRGFNPMHSSVGKLPMTRNDMYLSTHQVVSVSVELLKNLPEIKHVFWAHLVYHLWIFKYFYRNLGKMPF